MAASPRSPRQPHIEAPPPDLDPLPSTLSGANWSRWKEFVFPIESQRVKAKTKAKLQERRKDKPQTPIRPKHIRHAIHPSIDRLVLAGQRAAEEPDVPERVLTEIYNEIDKQIGLLQQSKIVSRDRIAAVQEEIFALEKRANDLAAKRAAVRQKWLQLRTARSQDESRKTDESIGSANDVEVTIGILEEEIEAVEKEVQYLRDVFGGGDEETDAREQGDVAVEAESGGEDDIAVDGPGRPSGEEEEDF
jgi:archaellum component FlaC